MPIYEFACPRCRVIFNFLSKKLNPEAMPACPKCGCRRLSKQVSSFALGKSAGEAGGAGMQGFGADHFDDPRVERAMGELEREATSLDEANPKHMARLLRKMQSILPPAAVSKEFDQAIRRLEAGEDPDTIEADMGPALDDFMGPDGTARAGGDYSRDPGLYDFQ